MKGKESRLTGLSRLALLSETAEATAEDMAAVRDRFDRLKDPASAPRAVASMNLFQTPEPLAAKLAGMFYTFGRTLEPSAGLGRLFNAVRYLDTDCPFTMVDISQACSRELTLISDAGATVLTGDFLMMGADRLGLFDSIIMNPPFKMGRDVKHVKHALTLLAEDGRLVSIIADRPRTREALEPICDQWIDLPSGSFKECGTNVGAAIVVFQK